MRIAVIIAEYNPFHNGHAHHIERTRAMGATHIVAVMSGNFVQRGVPALLYKQVRTVAALENGADLVVELPLPFALSTAEHFAYGGVKLLDALGCVDVLSFGSECGEIEPLIQAAMALEDIRVQGDIRRLLSEGMTYAKAREQAVELHISGETARILREPNNILGMEYLKAIADTDSHIRPVTVARTGTGHDSDRPAAQFASASHIRRRLMKQDPREVRHWMPKKAYRILKQSWKEGMCLRDQDSFERGMLPLLRSLSPEQIAALPDLSEGLENRVYDAIRRSETYQELLGMVKTKRYPMARIRRIVLSACLGIDAEIGGMEPPYLHLLGFNARGMEILKCAKQTAVLPMGTSLAVLERQNEACRRFARLESRSTDLYALFTGKVLPCGFDYRCKSVVIR